ncbi:GNAT family N-acetyltransferase [Litoreibacter sp.]
MEKSIDIRSVVTRDAARSDINRLLSMVQALASHHDDVPAVSQNALERDIFGEIPWIYVIVAEAGKEVVGYAALCPLIKLQDGARGIDLHHLFVENEVRGAGVGKLLIEASMQKARDLTCTSMTVGTHPDNLSAQAVYLACGFVQKHGSNPKFRISLE